MAEDPMISIMTDKDVIEIVSTLVAKLERIAFDDTRTGVFRTRWGRSLFSECVRRLRKASVDDPPFDIDEWYRKVIRGTKAKTRRDIDASVHMQSIDTDWLSELLSLELEIAGKDKMMGKGSFLRILYNALELEDKAQSKLASYCKEERQYNFMGVSMTKNTGNTLLLAPPPPTKPGSAEDLLKSTKKQ